MKSLYIIHILVIILLANFINAIFTPCALPSTASFLFYLYQSRILVFVDNLLLYFPFANWCYRNVPHSKQVFVVNYCRTFCLSPQFLNCLQKCKMFTKIHLQ